MSIQKVETSKGTRYRVRYKSPERKSREQWFARKIDAERFERSVATSKDTGDYRDPSLNRVTFREWHDRWWPTVEASDRAENTIVAYRTNLERHVVPQLGDMRLADIMLIDVQTWLAKLRQEGLATSTIQQCRTLAGMVLSSAADSGVIRANPMAGRRLVNRKGTSTAAKRALTAGQVEALADEADVDGYRELVLVLGYGGLRPNEAFALRRRHRTDFGQLLVEQGLVEVRGKLVETDGKTHRARIVPLPPSVLAAVDARLERVPADPEAPIFTTRQGYRLRLSHFSAKLVAAAGRAGLPEWFTPYTLRHTCATILASRGVPPNVAAEIMGHDPAMFLRVYAHLYPGDLRAAAAAMEGARSEATKADNVTSLEARRAGGED